MPSFLIAQQKTNLDTSTPIFQLTPQTEESIEQTGFARCLTDEYEMVLQEQYPNRNTREQFETWLAPKIEQIKADRLGGRSSRVIYNIPVVIHIIHDGDPINSPGNIVGENISDEQALSQIQVMNEDYRRLNGTPGGSNTTGLAVDVEINFCIAQTDPDGNETSGIVRHNISPYSNNVNDGPGGPDWETTSDVQSMKQATQWDPTKYLNMWVIRPGGLPLQQGGLSGLLGYAQFPDNTPNLGGLNNTGGAASTDGVVAGFDAMGTIAENDGSFVLNGTYNLGRTMTHEVGHWLGLRHIWGDGNCSADDFCDDTPIAGQANFSCNLNADSCPASPGNDQVQNYMDYTNDACMDTFTQDQKDRIQAIMGASPRRMELNGSTACQPAIIYALNAEIEIDNLNVANCSDYSITPELIITNRGTSTLSSATISYNLDGGANSNINWTGSLEINESETIYLPQLNTVIGAHVLNVSLNNPNGNTDEQTDDNADIGNFTITGSACESVGNDTDEYYTSTTGVVFNTINNLNNNPGGDVGYSDFTNLSTDTNREESYDLSVYYNPDGNYQTITYVWIDWNQNCSFDEPGEQYNLGTNPGDPVNTNLLSANSPLSISVPNDAVLGNTIMRVTTKYTDPNANQFPTPCEMNHDAEVEDYTINVLASLSVEEFGLNNISLYPNPTSNVLNISVSNNDLPDSYSIYNMLGQTVATKQISSNADLSINSSEFSNGMYFVKIIKNNSAVTLPFIKE